MISLSLIVFVASAFAVHLITDRVLIPEQWLLGLKWCLPPQFDPSASTTTTTSSSSSSATTNSSKRKSANIKKRRFSAANELYIRLETIQEDVLPHLYYFKEFDRLLSVLMMLLINYLFTVVATFIYNGDFQIITNLFMSASGSGGNNSVSTDKSFFLSASNYTLWVSILLITMVCYTSSQSTILGLRRTLRNLTLSNREDFLFILCFISSILSFLLSFTVLGGGSKSDSNFVFNMFLAGKHLGAGLKRLCHDNQLENCVHFLEADLKRGPAGGLLWIFLRTSCALLSSFAIFAVFMPIVRVVRCHVNMNSALMKQHYHTYSVSGDSDHEQQPGDSSRRKTMYSWLNILLPLFILACYYEPFISGFLGIHDRSSQLAVLYLLTLTSGLLGFYSVRCYVQSYLFYSVQYAIDDATKEAKISNKSNSNNSPFNKYMIRNGILKQKLLIHFKYVLLVALQVVALPVLQFASAVLLHVRGGFSMTQLALLAIGDFAGAANAQSRVKSAIGTDNWGQFFIHICGFLCFWANLCAFVIGALSLYWYGTESWQRHAKDWKDTTTTASKDE